jgi:putative PIN family toxin of toxin-antitoxin system
MRVLVDTNVFISYLLHPQNAGPVQRIFYALADEKVTLLIPEALLEEIRFTVASKPRLARRIPLPELDLFIASLRELATEIPLIEEPIPIVTRDPKDDYLLAYAFVGAADVLVTGDKDLLVLNDQIEGLHILTPRQFSELL